LWAVSALHGEIGRFSRPKMFILVSTVMTWACSNPIDPESVELPFTDEIFWRRKAHPNFQQHIELERRVVKLGKTNRKLFSTYVVASGLQYGMEEQVFHYAFKKSWLGQEKRVPVFGDGKNIVPMIHVKDLASVVQNVIQQRPKPFYLLAVDSSSNTMLDVVKTISSALGRGHIQKTIFQEAFFMQDLSVMEIDSLQVNLRMEAIYIRKLFSLSWLCETGLVENMEAVVEEYRQTRGLLPIRVCVLGPPAVGKTTMSKKICEHYQLHHIFLKDADVSFQSGGPPDEPLEVLKRKMMSNPCKNQGFVLDDFPRTFEQAEELFYAEEQEGVSQTRKMLPELVLSLDASDSFLIDRVINLPESLVTEHHYEQEHFLRRLARYREGNMEEEPVVHYFIEQDISPVLLEITSNDQSDWWLLMQKIFTAVGPTRNYGASITEVEEEERKETEERMKREAKERAEEEQQEEEEARSRAASWEESTRRLEEVRQQEAELLEAESGPSRKYLMEHVMPTLTQGLIECCTVQPDNPVDFLAEFLFKNNFTDNQQ
ncbi:adenylate kinase 7-like, partial [Brachyistius frenatus]|uniref:adenylate kinase 7-like n=1 Tax=Brachyistius frenatus TaxID=100188 RepID=UPI0037E78BCB